MNETKVLSPVERLWITCLSVSQPVFQIFTAQITVTHCGISNLSLFLGILLVLKAEKCSGLKHLVLRFSAILVFLLCFTGMDYFLLFYYGALLFVFLYIDRFEKLSMKSSLVTYILHRLDYLLLPVFVWSLKSNIFPKRGLYISQYAFDFSVNKIARVYLGFFEFIYTQISNVLKETLTYPLQWLILGSIYFLFHWLFGKKLSDYLNKQEFQNIKPYILLLYGLFFLVISIFPFAATKEMRIPFSGDWEIRHAFLIPLPIAITLVGAFRLLFPGNEHQVFSKSGGAILFILLFGFTKSTLNDYIALQARWVKDSSFIYNIRKLEGAKEMSIFWIDDQFPIIGRYRFHEWAGMFKHAWGDETHFGWNKEELRYFNNPEELFLRLEPFYPNYLLADFNPRGCQVDLVIRKGNQATNNLSMVINYFYYKYLKSQNLPEYLDGIVNISVNPINKTSVTNCDLRRYKKQP
ncbi:MAG: hypothetical protein HPY45_07515 [Anaerolineae bacterium]|nr:hypothetical protein [Anaerolineae bacterium]